jgi:hypothetical protein
MANEPKKWDGGPDFGPQKDSLFYTFSDEKIKYVLDLFDSDLRDVVSDYHGDYDSEIESLVNSVQVEDDFGVGKVESTPYVEFLLGTASVFAEMNRAKRGLIKNNFGEITPFAYGHFSYNTKKLLSDHMVSYIDLPILNERRSMVKALVSMQTDIDKFREDCDKKAYGVIGK